jgi:Nucleotidyltransferase of unknown function (DUF6036)
MPADRTAGRFPSPWKEFLTELDGILSEPLELHCIGGFVLTFFYGLPRTTGDIDYFSAVPANLNLEDIAGQDSPLHKKHKVWLHRVGVANLPEDYAARLSDMAPGQFKHLKFVVPDAYDCILSKLERASSKDRDDADYLFRSQKLDAHVLRERYKNELRRNLIGNVQWHDQTLELWIEIFEAIRQPLL